MTRLTTVFFFSCIFFCGSVSAQCRFVSGSLDKIDDEERALLRKLFKLPNGAEISEVKDKAVAAKVPLNVRVETIFDPTVRQLVTEWINEWNQKEADKYGKLNVAPATSQADVLVLRYSHRPATGLLGKVALTCKDPNGKVQRLIPIYSYLIVEKPDGLDILWRKAFFTYEEEHEFASTLLTDQLKKLMKNRVRH